MKILELEQGSAEWKAHRLNSRNASEANAVMGTDKYTSRAELIRQKATGDIPEPDERLQAIFDRGHAVEAAARPLAEEILGEELYPCTAVSDDDYLSASFDGVTMGEAVVWECKQWNQKLAEYVAEHNSPPPSHLWQLVQQMAVSGAEGCLFTVTDGTRENLVSCFVRRNELKEAELLRGWLQFDADVEAYKANPPAAAEPAAIGRSPMDLPALRIEVTGQVSASNLNEYRDRALAVLQNINRELSTDQDFADAEKTVKWCRNVEDKLQAAKDAALAQTASIDELFKTVDHLRDEARVVRLELDRLVKDRKKAVKLEIAKAARESFDQHCQALSDGLGFALPATPPDINEAMKGKRTIETLRDAADTAAAQAKIKASELAERMRGNLIAIEAAGRPELFADAPALAEKTPEDLQAVIAHRIQQADEQARMRAEAEAKRKAEAEAAEARRAEQAAAQPAPEPAKQAPQKPAPEQSQATKAQAWPTAAELVDVIAEHYATDEKTAREFIAHAFFESPKAA